jgi:5-formyltetrahydrofolate cyclo-ligase
MSSKEFQPHSYDKKEENQNLYSDKISKQQLRIWAKTERKKLNIKSTSEFLIQKLRTTPEYLAAKNILIFYPLEYEINLLKLLEDNTKNFYLPKISGENLLCCPYKLGEELYESCFKTKEPKTKPIKKDLIDLAIIPALAVDKNNYRLGYGGGYYDRLLKNTQCFKIVCISKKLLINTIHPEEHDIKIDKIICDD